MTHFFKQIIAKNPSVVGQNLIIIIFAVHVKEHLSRIEEHYWQVKLSKTVP